MSHYFTDNSDLSSDRREFVYYFDNEQFRFVTDNGVFSKGGVDYGSYLLIKNTYKRELGSKVLDLGSGYGPIGIIIKKFNSESEISMVDVNSRAIELSKLNIEKNNVDISKVYLSEDIDELLDAFDSIVLNPPIRTGKKMIYSLYDKSYNRLVKGGSLYIVIQKKHGAESSIKKLESVFERVNVLDKDGGYFVIQAVK